MIIMHRYKYLALLLSLFILPIHAKQIWKLKADGIVWKIDSVNIPHDDHIEMSGKSVASVLRYGIDSGGAFKINKSIIWPLLRTVPNNTHASLMRRYEWDVLRTITVNGRSLLENEKVKEVSLKGILTVKSSVEQDFIGQWEIVREFFPSTDLPALVELYQIINKGKNSLMIELPTCGFVAKTDSLKGVKGSYTIEGRTFDSGYYQLDSGDTLRFSAAIAAYDSHNAFMSLDASVEKVKRETLVQLLMNNLVLETPDPIIDQMFAYSKIRACESIYETQGGPLHGPGGESYYAAIWANDQAEYINPYFPFVGYNYGNISAMNSFRHFARFMNDKWEPIPSSIIAEGLDIWNGAGDRGDAAMIAYGASRYALARGRREEAEKLWPLITWCLEYCKRKLNESGVVTSDTDELENRFESGDANLCTSSLYYDALLSASYLAKELKKGNNTYLKEAETLKKNIEKYFGATVEGYDTYAYYAGNKVLRSWICIPLTVGIDERAEGTIAALFSPRLWTENGLLTEAGSETFWDRSTLYALRGIYTVGETEKATEYLHHYSETRLLGEHVPYAIEAWPEGNQRHLSAESGLYGRIITEGLFGIRPTGLKSFSLTPHLPHKWNYMRLKNIKAFDSTFDITVERKGDAKMLVKVSCWDKVFLEKIVGTNKTLNVNLDCNR